MFRIGQTVELRIDQLTNGGAGLGRSQGLVFFVPLTAPGDLIKARITLLKKNFAEAEMTELIEPSPTRATPPCPVYGECGGCSWQHIQYSEQTSAKERILQESLIKNKFAVGKILPLVASPKPFRYRNRIQLQARAGKVGFLRRKSHQIVPVRDCWLAEEDVADRISELTSTGWDRIDIRRSLDGAVRITRGEEAPDLGFSQVNTLQNQKMREILLEWSHSVDWNHLIDLYAGAGNLTLPILLDRLKSNPDAKATAVEGNALAVDEGQKSAKGLPIEFFCSSVEDFVLGLEQLPQKSLVVIDPPRQGCDKNVIEKLARWAPRDLFYVSCDVMTWGRDVQRLLALNPAYSVRMIQPLDMFPQTSHFEILSYLTLRSDA